MDSIAYEKTNASLKYLQTVQLHIWLRSPKYEASDYIWPFREVVVSTAWRSLSQVATLDSVAILSLFDHYDLTSSFIFLSAIPCNADTVFIAQYFIIAYDCECNQGSSVQVIG